MRNICSELYVNNPSLIIDLIQILELMSNPRLQNLLYMVLVAGNFLNSVSYILDFSQFSDNPSQR